MMSKDGRDVSVLLSLEVTQGNVCLVVGVWHMLPSFGLKLSPSHLAHLLGLAPLYFVRF